MSSHLIKKTVYKQSSNDTETASKEIFFIMHVYKYLP